MKLKLFTPGPVTVPEIVLKEMARPIISHRSSEFRRLLEEVTSKLTELFRLREGAVALLSGTGTTAVDAMLWSLVDRDSRVLAVSHGEFGDRIIESLARIGAQTSVLRARPGDVVWPEIVIERLELGEYDFVTLVHNETSTGTAYKYGLLTRIAERAYKLGVGLLIDTVSGLGGEEFAMRKGVWAAASCSHKALAAPPGVSFVALSVEALETLEKSRPRAPPVLDLRKYVDHFRQSRETPFTPPIPLVYALNKALDLVLERGVDEAVKAHEERARLIYEAVARTLLEPVPVREDIRSNTVVALWTKGIRAPLIRDKLRERGYLIAMGMGALRDKMIRIGVMGDISINELEAFIETLTSIIATLNDCQPGC